ncbi:MAG: sugar transferase [Limnothrix sp. RL_2_0]|nr:sugar transferase [Limnothrix sp. RL_2_0]
MRHLSKSLPSKLKADIRSSSPRGFTRIFRKTWYHVITLLASDTIALALAWHIARFFNQFYSPIAENMVWWRWLGLPGIFWIFAGCTVLLFAKYCLYSNSARAKDYVKAGQLVSGIYLMSLVLGYFYDPKLDLPRSLFFTAWFSSVFLIIFIRLLAHVVIARFERLNRPTVFIIASANRLHRISQVIENRSHYQVVGAAMASTANSAATFSAIVKAQAQEVLAEDVPQVELASGLYWRLRGAGIPLRLLPSSREMLYRRGMSEIFSGIPTLRVEPSFFQGLDYQVKRWFDFWAAAVGILILSPMFLLIAIAIKTSSPGPAFFRQQRMGLHGKIFHVWKFRTMVTEAPQLQMQLETKNETSDAVMFKIRHDPRIIPIGHFLRRTSLDELPQLFNVLLGQMSLVGPRPLPLRDTALFEPWHHIRHQVLPGITGLWQISGRSDIENFDDAARLDLHYIDNWSLNLDLEILLETIKIVCLGKGAY